MNKDSVNNVFKVKVNVTGGDKIERKLNDLERQADPRVFDEWIDRVGRTAKEICNDHDCKRIKITRVGSGDSRYEFADRGAIDCVIQSINRHLHSMPDIQKERFRVIVDQLEIQKRAMSA